MFVFFYRFFGDFIVDGTNKVRCFLFLGSFGVFIAFRVWVFGFGKVGRAIFGYDFIFSGS